MSLKTKAPIPLQLLLSQPARPPSTSQVRNWVHLPVSLLMLQCGSVGNSTHALLAYAGRQTAIFARTPHKEPCGMQPLLVPTQTACLCSVITLELVAINPSSWTRLILSEEASLGLLKVRKTAYQYLQRLHSPRFFCWNAFIHCLGYCKVSYLGIPAGEAEGIQRIGWD